MSDNTLDIPITDALSTDPAIERRDVPERVWYEMARIERERGELRDELQKSADTFKEIETTMRALGRAMVAESAKIAGDNARALLARLEKEPR